MHNVQTSNIRINNADMLSGAPNRRGSLSDKTSVLKGSSKAIQTGAAPARSL